MGNKHNTLTDEKVISLVSKNHLRTRQVRKLHKQFSKVSKFNKSLTRSQFVRLYHSLYQHYNINLLADHVFRVFAKQKKNSMNFEEFIRCVSVTTCGTLSEQFKKSPIGNSILIIGWEVFNWFIHFISFTSMFDGLTTSSGVDIPAVRHRREREREHPQYPSHPGSCKHSPTQPTLGYFCQDGHQQGRISKLWRVLQRMPQWSHFSEDYRRNEKTRAEEFFNLTQFCAKFCDVKMENMVQVFLWAKWYRMLCVMRGPLC